MNPFVKPLVLSFSTSRYPGQYIKKARLETGLMQKEVAEAIGVSEETIINWETADQVPARNLQKVKRACGVLEISYEELLKRFNLLWKNKG